MLNIEEDFIDTKLQIQTTIAQYNLVIDAACMIVVSTSVNKRLEKFFSVHSVVLILQNFHRGSESKGQIN